MTSIPDPLNKLFAEIDRNKSEYITSLKEPVAIKSVSVCPDMRPYVIEMAEWLRMRLEDLGAIVELRDIGNQTLKDQTKIPLPPVIFATIGKSRVKRNILIYGHYDVQPASKEDGWDTNPFELEEIDDKLYGRGVSDDKGPITAWIHALECYNKLNIDIPVNVRFIFEGMGEMGSIGLDHLLLKERKKFLRGIDYVCISDSHWLGNKKPCITYGLRGLCHFNLEIRCAKQDLHSGTHGGTVFEAMTDLIYLLNTLVDHDGKIKIKGVYEDVAKLMPEEAKLYDKIDFNLDEYCQSLACNKLLHENKCELLMHRWRYPTLSIHGIEGDFSETGHKTVIPAKVIGKFSIRLVPNQNPEQIQKCVRDYLFEKWTCHKSPNFMKCSMVVGSAPWMEQPNNSHYKAAIDAVKIVYGVEPDLIREGSSFPVILTLQEATGKNILLLPISTGDSCAHTQNEKLCICNYIDGTKLFAAYLYLVAQISR